MIWFKNEDNKKLKKLLNQSQQDFQFDQPGIKNRLMLSLEHPHSQRVVYRFFTFKHTVYASTVACVVILVSGTLTFASSAKPGDKLFGLNKFEEKFMLSLPLSAEQKANIQTRIVTKRIQALETVTTQPMMMEARQLDTVKESDESLQNAIDTISANKNKFETAGQVENAQHLGKILKQLDTLAQKHEQRVQEIEAASENGISRQTFMADLIKIRTARQKIQLQMHNEQPDDSSGN